MTDELTPEEREALDSLPRERMPAAGLEARVVDAMRDHGFLAKKHRVVELTRGRVAGVLAAGVALLIGAYSIGLHRGDSREILTPTTALRPSEVGSVETEESPADRNRDAPKATAPAPEDKTKGKVEQSADEGVALKKDAPRERAESAAPASEPAPATNADADRENFARSPEVDLRAQELSDAVASSPVEEQRRRDAAPAAGAVQPPTARMQAYNAAPSPKETITFLLDGTIYQVEADSVRVTADQQGRILHIYTASGVVRIRLAGQ